MNEDIILTNIQRCSLHDGPGIRTTVFLKGCSLSCPWCSNPENLSNQPQDYIKNGIKYTYGKYYNSDELVKECLKDRMYYEGKLGSENWDILSSEQIEQLPGGVTFSGGECLLQIEALIPVIKALHDNGIHVTVETCLFIPTKNMLIALGYIDLFYVDIKIINVARCKEIVNGDLNLYLTNFDLLMKSKKPVIIRIPVIGMRTDDEENRDAVRKLIGDYRERILKIELIKEHNLGEGKYQTLGYVSDYHGVNDELMEKYKNELSVLGIQTEICKV